MKKNLRFLALLGLSACARRVPTPAVPSPTPHAEMVPARPLKVQSPPPGWQLPQFQVPSYRLPAWRVPDLSPPQLEPPPIWKPAEPFPGQWHWHWDERLWQAHRSFSRFDFRAESQPQLQLPRVDVFKELTVPGLRNSSLDGALRDFEQQQKAQREKYDEFPIPVCIPIPF
jgi:hypothetical protein